MVDGLPGMYKALGSISLSVHLSISASLFLCLFLIHKHTKNVIYNFYIYGIASENKYFIKWNFFSFIEVV